MKRRNKKHMMNLGGTEIASSKVEPRTYYRTKVTLGTQSSYRPVKLKFDFNTAEEAETKRQWIIDKVKEAIENNGFFDINTETETVGIRASEIMMYKGTVTQITEWPDEDDEDEDDDD